MKSYLRLIDTQTVGPRCDVTPLFADPAAFAQLIADLSEPFAAVPLDYVAAIDALGFVLGGAMALRMGTGFIPIRKRGKLPVAARAVEFVDYSGLAKGLEIWRGLQPLALFQIRLVANHLSPMLLLKRQPRHPCRLARTVVGSAG